MKEDIEIFRLELWKTVRRVSNGMNTDDVILALEEITDTIYGAGIDEAHDGAKIQDRANIAEVWDCMWLAAWIKELAKIKEKRHICG